MWRHQLLDYTLLRLNKKNQIFLFHPHNLTTWMISCYNIEYFNFFKRVLIHMKMKWVEWASVSLGWINSIVIFFHQQLLDMRRFYCLVILRKSFNFIRISLLLVSFLSVLILIYKCYKKKSIVVALTSTYHVIKLCILRSWLNYPNSYAHKSTLLDDQQNTILILNTLLMNSSLKLFCFFSTTKIFWK